MKEIFLERNFLVAGGSIFFILFLFVLFPESQGLTPVFQSFLLALFLFCLFPMVYCKMIVQQSLSEIGFRFSGNLSGWVKTLFFVAIAYGLFFAARVFFSEFSQYDVLPFEVKRSFGSLVLYEVFVMMTLFVYEVFFRGFVMLFWLRSFGKWAFLLQSILLWGFLLGSGSFGWDQGRLILFAPFAGLIAFYTRSIGYSWIGAVLFSLLADVTLLVIS